VIQVGVIGAGQWGPNLIRHFDNRHSSCVATVVDMDPTRLEQVSRRFPEIRTTSDPGEVFSDSAIDAVVIATPTSTHFPLVRSALSAGKHVLVEKPLAASVEEGIELCELAERSSLTLMVGHVFVYNAGVRRVKQYIDDDELGRVYYVSMVRTNLGPIRMDVNAAWDLASHDISIANFWFGASPISVSAVGGRWINEQLEDAVFATLRYPDEVLVNVHASWLNPRKARDITVVGDRKMLTLDDLSFTEPIRIFDKRVTDERVTPSFVDSYASFRASVRDGDIHIPKVTLDEPLRAECDHFIACLSDNREPATGGRQGLAVVEALDALRRSISAGGHEEPVANEHGVAASPSWSPVT
jgi:predicted dehydrogenase